MSYNSNYGSGSSTSRRTTRRAPATETTTAGNTTGTSTRTARTSESTATTSARTSTRRTGTNSNVPATTNTTQNLPVQSNHGGLASRFAGLGKSNPEPYRAAGGVSLTGRVVSFQARKRRKDIFHVLFDTLVNGAPMTFSPLCHVMNVELNDSDYTQIDSSARRSVVVNIVGNIYDGTINPGDTVSVQGQWSTHHTINATKVTNLSNGSSVTTSHALPANAARILLALLIVGIIMLIRGIKNGLSGLSAPAAPSVPTSSGLSSGPLLYLLVGAVLLWILFRLNRRRVGFFFRKVASIIVGIILFYILLKVAPGLLTSLLVIALMIYLLICMIRGSFR